MIEPFESEIKERKKKKQARRVLNWRILSRMHKEEQNNNNNKERKQQEEREDDVCLFQLYTKEEEKCNDSGRLTDR